MRRLYGDVTGDGRSDVVALSEEGKNPYHCRPVLTIGESAGRTIRHALPVMDSQADLGGFTPSFLGLGRIDRRPGLEMVVVLACGTVCSPSVWTVAGGRVVAEPFIGTRYGVDYGGGTASSWSSVDCTATPGELVFAWGGVVNWQNKKRWRVIGERDVFRAEGTRLVYQPVATRRRTLTVAPFSEYAPPLAVPPIPFGNCLEVQGDLAN